MTQLAFPSDCLPPKRVGRVAGRLDARSEALLETFRARRLAAGAHPRSVAREVSQLRAVTRDGADAGEGDVLATVCADIGRVARVLREPREPIARSTGRARLVAVQRFLRLIGPDLGRDPDADLSALDALLPLRRSAGWHAAGVVVAGAGARRRRRGPTLDAADLGRIVAAAAVGRHAVRDRALVALHCFSGLRAEEIVRLRCEDLATERTANGYDGPTVRVQRNGKELRLPLPGPAAAAVAAQVAQLDRRGVAAAGPLFRPYGGAGRALGYRAARAILDAACRGAGLPPMDSAELRAACAHWLRIGGLSDHEVVAVLGLARVKSLDRLLLRHRALDAQRVVREALAP